MPQQRLALVVAGAAGPQDIANAVLQRFGFAPAQVALSVSEAVGQLRNRRFDLLVIPLQTVQPAELAALDREVRRHGGVFLIGTAAQEDPELILRGMRSGIHEFIVYPPDPAELAAAVDRLMRRSHSDGPAGQTLAVYSAKGGLGTTTIAVNLAFAIARADPTGRVALVDAVTAGGDVGVLLNLRPGYDLADVARKVDQLDGELLRSFLTPTEGGVWVLRSGEDAEADDAIDGTVTTAILDHLRANFACTVVDCEHHLGERTLAALDAADRVLLVTQLNVAALRSTQRTLTLLQRLGYPDEKTQVVVNRYKSGDALSVADATQVLRREPGFKIPNDYQVASAALARGVVVAAHAPTSALAGAYGALAAQLVGTHAGAPGAVAGNGAAATNGRGGGRLGRILRMGRRG